MTPRGRDARALCLRAQDMRSRPLRVMPLRFLSGVVRRGSFETHDRSLLGANVVVPGGTV